MEKIILFNCENVKEISAIASNIKVRVTAVGTDAYDNLVQDIVRGAAGSEVYTYNKNEKSLILMCNLSDKHLNKMLSKLREKNISVDYKSILTPVNSKWNVRRLFAHMELESSQWGIKK